MVLKQSPVPLVNYNVVSKSREDCSDILLGPAICLWMVGNRFKCFQTEISAEIIEESADNLLSIIRR